MTWSSRKKLAIALGAFQLPPGNRCSNCILALLCIKPLLLNVGSIEANRVFIQPAGPFVGQFMQSHIRLLFAGSRDTLLLTYHTITQAMMKMYESLKADYDALKAHHKSTSEQNDNLRVSIM